MDKLDQELLSELPKPRRFIGGGLCYERIARWLVDRHKKGSLSKK